MKLSGMPTNCIEIFLHGQPWMNVDGWLVKFFGGLHWKSRLRNCRTSLQLGMNGTSAGKHWFHQWSFPIDPILGVTGVTTKDERRWQRTMGRYQGPPENAAPAPGSAGRWWNLRSSAFLCQDLVGFQRIFWGCSSHFTVVFTYFWWDSSMSMVVQSETWGPIGMRHGLQGLFTGLLEAKAVGPEWVKHAWENDDEPSGFISWWLTIYGWPIFFG